MALQPRQGFREGPSPRTLVTATRESSMFETIETAPPDPIIGLTEAFQKDPRPNKINLGVGVYKDAKGNTPVFAAVKKAQERLLQDETTKDYSPIEGPPEFAAAVQHLLFGAGHEVVAGKRAVTSQTPGGTGALRVAADFIHKLFPRARLWISDPTWANHPRVFEAAGLQVRTYPYYDAATHGLDLERMLSALREIPPGDIALLHGCCHNPTGVDPTPDQWKRIAAVIGERRIVPLVDFAYQGMGKGLREDTDGLQQLCRTGVELFVASSFSKNFGLYNERIGALTLIAPTRSAAAKAMSHLKICIRTNYSNPPAHGGAIVSKVLQDEGLRRQWEEELTAMCARINGMRALFAQTLETKGVDRDFSFIRCQRGMFSFSGLSPDQVEALRSRYSIYLVGSGRINVAGMTPANMDYLCSAIAAILR